VAVEGLVEVIAIAALGTVIYWLIRTMGQRPLAEIVKILCFVLGSLSFLRWFMELYNKAAQSPLARFVGNVNKFLEK
jgi:hypothetical protein